MRGGGESRWARCERRAHADYTWGVESDTERRRQGRLWLDDWRAAGERLERERWQHVQALDEDSAWEQAQELFALVESEWTGDAGEGLLLQQDVFRRVRPGPPR